MRAELFRLHRLVAALFALVALFSCNRGVEHENIGQSGAALIGAICATAADCGTCETCTGSKCVANAAKNGVSCDDGNACSTGDVCSAGVCSGSGKAASGTVCRAAATECDIAETCPGNST